MEQADSYWDNRKDILYYQVTRILVQNISKKAKSIIDVGSAGCPYLEWFPHIEKRVSLDIKKPYSSENIQPITSDFIEWIPDQKYDVVMCLQVLEHVPDAKSFAQKLLKVGNVVVVSVPYKWHKDKTKSHIHDPVDEKKLLSWFGRKPNFSYICREVLAPVDRIIHVYEPFHENWSALNRRDSILKSVKQNGSNNGNINILKNNKYYKIFRKKIKNVLS